MIVNDLTIYMYLKAFVCFQSLKYKLIKHISLALPLCVSSRGQWSTSGRSRRSLKLSLFRRSLGTARTGRITCPTNLWNSVKERLHSPGLKYSWAMMAACVSTSQHATRVNRRASSLRRYARTLLRWSHKNRN